MTQQRFRWGMNVLGNSVGDNDQVVIDYFKNTQPTWGLIMSNIILLEKCQAVAPTTHFIDRPYSTAEGKQPSYMTGQAYAKTLKDGRHSVWKHVLNEPNTNNEAEVKHLVKFLVDAGRELVDDGYMCVLGNLPAGDWDMADIQQGLYDPLLYFLAEHSDVAVLGLHTYESFILTFNKDRWKPEHLLDPQYVQPDTWMTLDHPDPALRLADPSKRYVERYWHILREVLFVRRCMELGIKIRIVETEYGWDTLFKGTIAGESVFEVAKRKYGIAEGFNHFQGPHSYKNVWASWWQEWSLAQAMVEQLKNMDKIYRPDWVEGFMLYTMSEDYWAIQNAYMYWQDREWQERMVSWAQSYDVEGPEPPVDPKPVPIPKPDNDKSIIDMWEYIGQPSPVHDIQWDFPGHESGRYGSHATQVQVDGNRVFHVKGGWWEELFLATDNGIQVIKRGTDTTPTNEELYTVYGQDGFYGENWINRYVEVGDQFFSDSHIEFRRKSDGKITRDPYDFPHWITVKAFHEQYTFESGITLNNVVELWGHLDANGTPGFNFERYMYAKGRGLVGWSDPSRGWKSFISAFNPMERVERNTLPDWFSFTPIPDINEDTDMPIPFPDIAGAGWTNTLLSSTGESTNIRSQPLVLFNPSNKLGEIRLNRPVRINKDKAKDMPDGLWYPILYDEDVEATPQTAIYEVEGWVHSDYVNEPQDPNEPKPPSGDYTAAILSLKPPRTTWNMREQPSVQSDSIGVIENEVRHVLINKSKAEQFTDGVWYPILIADDPQEELANREKFIKPGWVRGDGIVIQDYAPVPDPEPEPEPDPELPKQGNFIDHYMPEFLLSDTELDSLIKIRQWELDMLKHYRDNRNNPNVDGIVVYFPKDNPPPNTQAEEAGNDTNLSELQQETG